MTKEQKRIDSLIPLSEKTIIKHKYIYKGLSYHNDIGYPCEYRIFKNDKYVGLIVKYYAGRKLTLWGEIKNG